MIVGTLTLISGSILQGHTIPACTVVPTFTTPVTTAGPPKQWDFDITATQGLLNVTTPTLNHASASVGSFTTGETGAVHVTITETGLPMNTTVQATDVYQCSSSTSVDDSPTLAPYAGLRVSVAQGWTTIHWTAARHVMGYNVFHGTTKLNRTLVVSGSNRYSFRVHAVVRHPILVSVALTQA